MPAAVFFRYQVYGSFGERRGISRTPTFHHTTAPLRLDHPPGVGIMQEVILVEEQVEVLDRLGEEK